MNRNIAKDIIYVTALFLMVLFFRDIPLKWQGLVGYLFGVVFMWSRIKEKE